MRSTHSVRLNDAHGPLTTQQSKAILAEGPIVNEFQKMVMATWEEQKGEPLAPKTISPN